MAVDGQDSWGVIDGIVSVCDPDDGLLGDFVVPDPDVAEAGLSGAEEAEGEGLLAGEQNVPIADGAVLCDGVKDKGDA